MNKVLIITNKEDVTVDFIVSQLNYYKAEFYRMNTEEIGHSLFITIDPTNNIANLYDKTFDTHIDLLNFDSVYYRRPQVPAPPVETSYNEKVFFNNEYMVLFDGIYYLLKDKKWLNHPINIRNAENKVKQQAIASTLGFKTPNSIITNYVQSVKQYIDISNNIIFKPLKCGFIGEGSETSSILYTSKVDKMFLSNIDRIKPMPVYFQNEIIKAHDIRVTTIDQDIFACAIDSQNNNESKLDWRAAKDLLPHSKIELPNDIKKKIHSLMQEYHLNFSAIDLILSTENEYYFLEINPNGQWAWIEQFVGYPISQKITKYLLT